MNIIASTDFSQTADNAVQYAAALAQKLGYNLILFHAFKIPLHASHAHLSAENFQNILYDAANKLQKKADSLAETYKIGVTAECSFSYIEDYLLFLIEQYNPKMLVTGMAEKSLEQELMGNTTTSIIKNIRIPVLAVPLNARFQNIDKILFACDHPRDISVNVAEQLSAIAARNGSEVQIFSVEEHVAELKAENSPALAANASDANLKGINYYYKNVRSNAVIEAIKKEAEDIKADLLIMSPKEYGFWEALIHRSKTRMMASGLSIPLLSIPE